MIKNARQYNRARKNLSGFSALKRRVVTMLRDFELDDSELISIIDKRISLLTDQLAEYKMVDANDNQELTLFFANVSTMPSALLKARLFLGWSQSELACRTGLTKQQVHAYEKTSYSSMAISRFLKITDIVQQALNQR